MAGEREGSVLPHSPDAPTVLSEDTFRRTSEGQLVVDRAAQLRYEDSSRHWQALNDEMSERIDRRNFQIVPLFSKRDNLPGNLYPMGNGQSPLAELISERFPDGEPNLTILHEQPGADHLYIVGSIEGVEDYFKVLAKSDHYKHTLNAQYVTLIATYLAFTRQDKNVDSKGQYQPKTLNIRTAMRGLENFVDRMIVYEPHSTATQYYAWNAAGIPLAPITPWKSVMKEVLSQPVAVSKDELILPDPENALIVGPDKGRNWAATRIAEEFGLPYLSLDKTRLDGFTVEFARPSDTEIALLEGRIAFVYDDEGSTFGTVNGLAKLLEKYGVRAFIPVVVHIKGSDDWSGNIDHPLIKSVYITDSREPVRDAFDVYGHPKIRGLTLANLTRELIRADVEGVNFWEEPSYSGVILQKREN